MKNRITISIPFCFKGEEFTPTCIVDLDEQMKRYGSLPCLYTHLAEENGISPYSYEHDVMMMGDIEYADVEGLASAFIDDGRFDTEGFEKAWHQQRVTSQLREIAARHLGVDNLDKAPETKNALQEAFELGIEEGKATARQIRSTPLSGF